MEKFVKRFNVTWESDFQGISPNRILMFNLFSSSYVRRCHLREYSEAYALVKEVGNGHTQDFAEFKCQLADFPLLTVFTKTLIAFVSS